MRPNPVESENDRLAFNLRVLEDAGLRARHPGMLQVDSHDVGDVDTSRFRDGSTATALRVMAVVTRSWP